MATPPSTAPSPPTRWATPSSVRTGRSYGTDYPFGAESGEDFYRENMDGVKAMNIPDGDMKKVLGENARKLLKIR